MDEEVAHVDATDPKSQLQTAELFLRGLRNAEFKFGCLSEGMLTTRPKY